MNFRKYEIKDRTIIDKFKCISIKRNCDFNSALLFIWKDYYITEIFYTNDILYLRYYINNEYLYFIPLGDTEKGILELIKYTRLHHQKLKIINIEQQDLKYFNSNFLISHIRNNDDYLYSCNELSLLQGKKYKAKRNLVNSFQKKYSYQVIPLKESYIIDNTSFLDFLNESSTFDKENEVIRLALKHQEELKLDGLVLMNNQRIIGLTIGSYEQDTFITHFEKVDYSFNGVAQMINYLLANYVKDKVTYINREEDLGIEGLRKAKLSYNPIEFIKSYTAYYKEDFKEKEQEYERDCNSITYLV